MRVGVRRLDRDKGVLIGLDSSDSRAFARPVVVIVIAIVFAITVIAVAVAAP